MIKKDQRGFTFTELMIALGISSIVLLGINSVLINQHNAHVVKEQIIDMQERLRIAMNLMSREIRMAGYDPRGNSGAQIVTANQDSIHFTRDLDQSSSIIEEDEDLEYLLYKSGGIQKLGRKIGAITQPVVEHIESLAFVYTQADGTAITDISQIRNVKITLTARTALADPNYPDNDGHRTRTLTTNVSLRN